jgi:hypothetical protein
MSAPTLKDLMEIMPYTRNSMNMDYEVELRIDLRRGRRVHIVNTDDGMILAYDFPYHGNRFIRIPEQMEAEILKLCADPTLSTGADQ